MQYNILNISILAIKNLLYSVGHISYELLNSWREQCQITLIL